MKRTLWLAWGLVLVAVILGALWANQSDDSLVVRVAPERPGELLSWNAAASRARVLYESAGVIDEPAVARGGRRVAFLEQIAGAGSRQPKSRLVVLDRRASELFRAEDVWGFTWAPDGKRIAYVTGKYYEGGVGFQPRRAQVVSLESGESRPLTGVRRAYELRWLTTSSEDAVYARVLGDSGPHHVLRWDAASGAVTRPTEQAVHFSPDGFYYYLEPYETIERGVCSPGLEEDSCLRVYERRGRRWIPELSSREWGTLLGWVGSDGHRLLFGAEGGNRFQSASSSQLEIVDARSATSIEVVQSESVGGVPVGLWRAAGDELIRGRR